MPREQTDMERSSPYKNLPPDGLATPFGRLYRPQGQIKQIVLLIAAFVASMSLGGIAAAVPGDLSSAARVLFHVPFALVFFVGYSVWLARINALVFQGIGRSLLKALWMLIVRRKSPESPESVLPSREKLLEMLVKAQRAGASFRVVCWPIAVLGAFLGILCESRTPRLLLAALLAAGTLAWGYFLALLGRRGWLPFPEGD